MFPFPVPRPPIDGIFGRPFARWRKVLLNRVAAESPQSAKRLPIRQSAAPAGPLDIPNAPSRQPRATRVFLQRMSESHRQLPYLDRSQSRATSSVSKSSSTFQAWSIANVAGCAVVDCALFALYLRSVLLSGFAASSARPCSTHSMPAEDSDVYRYPAPSVERCKSRILHSAAYLR